MVNEATPTPTPPPSTPTQSATPSPPIDEKYFIIVNLASKIKRGKPFAGFGHSREELNIARQLLKGNYASIPAEYQAYAKDYLAGVTDLSPTTIYQVAEISKGKVVPPKEISGYEVSRGGQAMSVTEKKPGDVVLKTIYRPIQPISKGASTGEVGIYNKQGELVGVESKYFQQSLPIAEYERRTSALPQLRYFNPQNEIAYEKKQILFEGKGVQLSSTPYRVYTTPKGELIPDVEAYLKQQKIYIPPGEAPKIGSYGELLKELKEPQIISKEQADILSTESMIRRGEVQSGYASSAEDVVLALATGGVGLAKGGALTALKIIFAEPITKTSNLFIDRTISPSKTGFSLRGMPKQVARGGLFLATLPVTGVSYSYEFGKSILTEPKETITSLSTYAFESPYEFGTITFGGLATAKLRTEITQLSLFGKKPIKIVPDKELVRSIEDVSKQSRQRATFMLKDESGKYILGKTKSGEGISFGGKIEPKETPRQAALRELKEETGLIKSDIKNISYGGKIVTPEETFFVYTGIAKDINKIKASSDVKKIFTFKPEKAYGITGQTAIFPTARYSFVRGVKGISKYIPSLQRVRAYEYGIINYLETGQAPTWLVAVSKKGSYVLGTQSRYDVPYEQLKKFIGEETLLASGTTNPLVLRKLFSFREKVGEVSAKFSKRGKDKGLYVSPAIAKKQMGYLGLSYLRIGKTMEGLGLKIASPKRTSLIFKERVFGAIQPTAKTFAGQESEFIIEPPTRISTIGRAQRFSIGLRRVYFQPAKIISSGEKPLRRVLSESEISKASYEGYDIISPSQLLPLPSKKPTSKLIESETLEPKILPSLIYKKKNDILPSFTNKETSRKISYKPSSVYKGTSKVNDIINSSEPYEPIKYSEPPIKRLEPSVAYKPPRYTRTLVPSTTRTRKNEVSKPIRSKPAYAIKIRRKGKFIPIATDLPKGVALKLLQKRLLTNIARTGKIVETGRTTDLPDIEFAPSEKIFRRYQVKRGKRIDLPLTFIQRTEANLQTREERMMLAQARQFRGI